MYKIIALFSALWVLLAGCSIGSPDGQEVAQLVDEFYEVRKSGDIDAMLPYYAGGRTPEQWRHFLEHVRDSLGTVKEVTLKQYEVNTVLSGRFYIFEHQVTYDSGKQAKETVTFFDTVEADDKTHVAAHNILAEGFRSLF